MFSTTHKLLTDRATVLSEEIDYLHSARDLTASALDDLVQEIDARINVLREIDMLIREGEKQGIVDDSLSAPDINDLVANVVTPQGLPGLMHNTVADLTPPQGILRAVAEPMVESEVDFDNHSQHEATLSLESDPIDTRKWTE